MAGLLLALAACAGAMDEIEQLNDVARRSLTGLTFHYRISGDCVLAVERRREDRTVVNELEIPLKDLRARIVVNVGRGFGVTGTAGSPPKEYDLLDTASEAQARTAMRLLENLAERCR